MRPVRSPLTWLPLADQPAQARRRSFLHPAIFGGQSRLAVAVMLCALGFAGAARAEDCGFSTMPGDAAGTSALFNRLASNVAAEPLALSIEPRGQGGSCRWVYEVKVLTESGSVAYLDFDLVDLDLTQVTGPQDDPGLARLIAGLGGLPPVDGTSRDPDGPAEPSSSSGSGSSSSSSSDSGSDDDGGDDGGEGGDDGGNSGSGGGGNSGSGGGGDGGGGEGGEGGGGEGGEGGGDD